MAVVVLIDKVDWQKALKVPEDAWRIASVQLMEEIAKEVRTKAGVTGYTEPTTYRASKPGEYPKKKSGWFSDGISVGATKQDLEVGLYSRARYGITLEEGDVASNLSPRPWLTLTLKGKDWMKRLLSMGRRAFGKK